MAAQRGFEATAQGRAMNGRHNRLGEVLNDLHGVEKIRRLERFAELGNVHTGDKGPAGADENRCDGVVFVGFSKALRQALAHMLAQRVHGRIVDGDDADVVLFGIANRMTHSATFLHSCFSLPLGLMSSSFVLASLRLL